jgi:hypothetical protein
MEDASKFLEHILKSFRIQYILSIEKSKKLTTEYIKSREYPFTLFNSELQHDIIFYNQITTIMLGAKSALRHFKTRITTDSELFRLEFLHYLYFNGYSNFKKFTKLIFGYLNEYIYDLKLVPIRSLVKIAKHLKINF